MITRLLSVLLLLFALAGRAGAQDREATQTLIAALEVPAILDVMRLEGLDYGKQLEEDLFPGQGGKHWLSTVAGIYDPARMRKTFDMGFAGQIPADDARAITAFFTSPRGHRIARLEASARRELLKPRVEDASKRLLRDIIAHDNRRLTLLQELAVANDLVESNVTGTMNSDVAFYKGLVAGHADGFDMTEDEILQEVWSQEDDIRKETEDWLMPYLALAYQPLSNKDLVAYIAFSRSPAGKTLNQALFHAFDKVFDDVSHNLGIAAARYLSGQDI